MGRLLVAMTERGVCAVRMGDNDAELEKDLREEFPQAADQTRRFSLREPVQKILNHLDNNEPRLDLPLDIRSTAFQRQVWEKLRAIPYGQTVSYGDVAKALGKPGAVRAVGRACATNPVALVIPCHRVVREDKSLGGYRWGLGKKEEAFRLGTAERKGENRLRPFSPSDCALIRRGAKRRSSQALLGDVVPPPFAPRGAISTKSTKRIQTSVIVLCRASLWRVTPL